MKCWSLIVVAGIVASLTHGLEASDGCCKPPECGAARCGSCMLICRAEVSLEPVKKTCWDVECKHICIPPVRFPWQKCCEPLGCGKIRTVKSLKQVEYECGQKCVYKWSVENLGCVGSAKPACWSDSTCCGGSAPVDARPTPGEVPPAPGAAE